MYFFQKILIFFHHRYLFAHHFFFSSLRKTERWRKRSKKKAVKKKKVEKRRKKIFGWLRNVHMRWQKAAYNLFWQSYSQERFFFIKRSKRNEFVSLIHFLFLNFVSFFFLKDGKKKTSLFIFLPFQWFVSDVYAVIFLFHWNIWCS